MGLGSFACLLQWAGLVKPVWNERDARDASLCARHPWWVVGFGYFLRRGVGRPLAECLLQQVEQAGHEPRCLQGRSPEGAEHAQRADPGDQRYAGHDGPHIASGNLRALAVIGDGRLKEPPDVPTVAEAGFPDVEYKHARPAG